VKQVVAWYLETAYGRWEGPGTVPFFADRSRVGPFAVDADAVAAGDPDALFQVLITLSSYQARRDVDIMTIQRTMPKARAKDMTSSSRLRVLVDRSRCQHLRDAGAFDRLCDVRRDFRRGIATCATHPHTPCHVKQATEAIGRMGDLGKLPTSAWLHLGPAGLPGWLADECRADPDPHLRASALVRRVSSVYRIGIKLASMFVTSLSVPELGFGAPWFPEVDGSRIVVIDANVSSAIKIWRQYRGSNTYSQLARWIASVADTIDLSRLRSSLPARSPRLVQQAVYVFRSRSNRVAVGDACATRSCASCPSRVCPFRANRSTSDERSHPF
jgi:hypothetical protein